MDHGEWDGRGHATCLHLRDFCLCEVGFAYDDNGEVDDRKG